MIFDLRRYRKIIIVILIAIVGICLLLLAGKKYSSDITDMLPEGSVAARMLKYLQEENIAGRITVELRLKDNCENLKLLPQSVTQLETTLKHPDIISIFAGFAMPGAETLAGAYTALPELVSKEDMTRVAEMTGMDEISRTMRGNYIRLAAPGGAEMSCFIEKDPLGLNRIVLKKLGLFSDIVAYRTAPGSTMLIGPDQRRALLIIETAIPVSDSRRAAGFLSFLDGAFKNLPEQVTASVMCGHKHTIGNEKVIAGDIPKVSIASLIIFALLFAVIYRKRPQAFLIVLMPMVAVLITVAVMGLAIDRISAFVIGFGGVMAGISVDYGICVYELCGRTSGNRMHEVGKIVRPLFAGALTTIGIFLAFLFSGTGAYIQLAIFAMLSISLSLAMAVYVLPNLLTDNVKSSIIQLKTPVFKYRTSCFIAAAWGIVIAASTTLALSFSFFDSSVTSLDGAGKDVINAEADFNAYWSKREMPAILAIKGKDREQVLQTGESLAAMAAESGIKGFVSPVMLTPSSKAAQVNRNAWREFWTEDKINQTLTQIALSGGKNGFREDAFNEFKAWLPGSRDNSSKYALLTTIQDKLLKRNGDEWTLASFMIDSPENYRLIEKAQKQLPALRVISPRVLRFSIGEEELNRLLGIGAASFVIVLLLSILATGGIMTGIVALLPVVAAVATICGFSAALNLPLTIPSCVAMIIIIGLSSDYGIFMVFRCFKSLQSDVMTSVALCAMTTAAGALTLLFASHPVMFKLGIALFAGIVISYVAAVTLIPALAVLIKGKYKTGIQALMFFAALTGCAGCSLYNTLPEPGPLLSSPAPQAYNPPDKQWSTVSSLTFSVSGYLQDSLLCAAEFDAVSRGGSIVCMQPAGIKILETSFRGNKITHRFVIPELEKRGLKVDDVVRDLQRINFDARVTNLPGIIYEFDKNTGMLMAKKFIKNGRCIWTISYRQYKLISGYSVPFEIRMDSSAPEYSLLIRIKEFSEISLKRVP